MSFDENEIRPKKLDELRFAARKIDIAWLNERKSQFVDSACPACENSENAISKFTKYGFEWRECHECCTAYMTPRPTSDLLEEFYARSELYKIWDKHIFPATSEVRRVKIFRPRVEKMLALLDRFDQRADVMFEVGAAHGIFCDEVKQTGQFTRVVAIEPSAQQAQTCRNMGLETIETVIENVQGEDGSADVVAAFEVLEHLSEPVGMIQAMKRLLRPGGLLLLSTPNVKGFEILTLGAKVDAVYPEHVTLFSPRGMAKLMERAGLEIIELSTPGVLDCDIVRNKAIEGAIDLSAQPFLQKILIDEWDEMGKPFQEFLSTNNQSSHMWIAARRAN